MDPVFLKFSEQLAKHRQTQAQTKQSYSSLMLVAPQKHTDLVLPKLQQKMSSDNV